jgi:hypothetical protein
MTHIADSLFASTPEHEPSDDPGSRQTVYVTALGPAAFFAATVLILVISVVLVTAISLR